MKFEVIEVPDYRGLIERLAEMLDRGFASQMEAVIEYDALAQEARAILMASPDAPKRDIREARKA